MVFVMSRKYAQNGLYMVLTCWKDNMTNNDTVYLCWCYLSSHAYQRNWFKYINTVTILGQQKFTPPNLLHVRVCAQKNVIVEQVAQVRRLSVSFKQCTRGW